MDVELGGILDDGSRDHGILYTANQVTGIVFRDGRQSQSAFRRVSVV